MAQRTKLIIAAMATALLASVGAVGATTGAVDAGHNVSDTRTGGAWCC